MGRELKERGAKTNMALGALAAYTATKVTERYNQRDYYDGESGLEARGAKSNVAVGGVGGYLLGKAWQKFGEHRQHKQDDAAVEARDLVDFIYAQEVLDSARAMERREALKGLIDELD